jgi:hypothetical protein
MKPFRMIQVLVFCCLGLVLLTESGCVSGRTITTLKPVPEPGLNVPGSRFYIADLKYTTPANPYSAKQEARISQLFKKECPEDYPNLFTSSPDGSIPLRVEVNQTTKAYIGKTMCWMYGTLLISGLILPCPGQTDESYNINVSVWNSNPALPGQSCATNGFRNEYYTWCSILTPAALKEIPGESDFPKISGSIFNMEPMMEDYYKTISSQLAAAVAHAVVGAAPEITKAQAAPQTLTQAAPPSVPTEKSSTVSSAAVLASVSEPQPVQVAPVQSSKMPVADIPTQLKKLDELKALGLITEDEYKARKKELTGKL